MTFDDQIKHLCKASFFHLRNLFRMRRYLTDDCASKVIHAFITSRIDYCNHLYYGLPKYQLTGAASLASYILLYCVQASVAGVQVCQWSLSIIRF